MSWHRYLILSDVLYAKDSKIEDERWFPPQVAAIRSLEVLVNKAFESLGMAHREVHWSSNVLRWFDRSTKEGYEQLLEAASEIVAEDGPFNAIIGAGNYSIGVRESGMINDQCITQFRAFDYKLRRYLGDSKQVLAPGGHDIGYRYHVKERTKVLKIGNETGGLSEKSVKAYQELIGPLYDLQDLGRIRVLYISTGLIRNVNGESSLKLQTLKAEQFGFIKKTLEELDNSKPTFLVMHDPTALPLSPGIVKLLWKHREKLSAIIHGHSRARFVATLTKLNSFYRKLCATFTVICNPAPAGMFGIGKGFTTLYAAENGAWCWEMKRIKG